MKLREAELQRADLNGQVMDLRRDLKSQNEDISIQIASRLETLIVDMIRDTADSFQGYDQLLSQKRESKESFINAKDSIENSLQMVFQVIGKGRTFDQI